MKKRCGNCANYFINRQWEKWCAEQTTDASGNPKVVLKEKLGNCGDELPACQYWKPSEGYLRIQASEKAERAARRAAKRKGGQA